MRYKKAVYNMAGRVFAWRTLISMCLLLETLLQFPAKFSQFSEAFQIKV